MYFYIPGNEKPVQLTVEVADVRKKGVILRSIPAHGIIGLFELHLPKVNMVKREKSQEVKDFKKVENPCDQNINTKTMRLPETRIERNAHIP